MSILSTSSREAQILRDLDQLLPLEESFLRSQRTVAIEGLRITLFFCAPAIFAALITRAYFKNSIEPLPFFVVLMAVGTYVYARQEKFGVNSLRSFVSWIWVLGLWSAFATTGVTAAGPYLLSPALVLAVLLAPKRYRKYAFLIVTLPVLILLQISMSGLNGNTINLYASGGDDKLQWITPAVAILISSFFMQRIMLVLVEVLRRQDRTARLTFYRSLAAVATLRDNETGAHMRRCAVYARLIAEHDREGPFSGRGRADLTALELAVPLHDIGKVGIPDSILLKPGKLTTEEFDLMKRHTLIGWDLIRTMRDQVGMDHDKVLSVAENIAIAHHENWDGSGYPFGLKGADIPYEARIMAIVDVYDALRSTRAYKIGHSHAEAMRIMADLVGKKFDPRVYKIFKEHERTFALVYQKNMDSVQSNISRLTAPNLDLSEN